MTTVQIDLPDELAHDAASAGLLAPDAMAAMLRDQLRHRAGQRLQAIWRRGPRDELGADDEQAIVDEVRQVRAERRARDAG